MLNSVFSVHATVLSYGNWLMTSGQLECQRQQNDGSPLPIDAIDAAGKKHNIDYPNSKWRKKEADAKLKIALYEILDAGKMWSYTPVPPKDECDISRYKKITVDLTDAEFFLALAVAMNMGQMKVIGFTSSVIDGKILGHFGLKDVNDSILSPQRLTNVLIAYIAKELKVDKGTYTREIKAGTKSFTKILSYDDIVGFIEMFDFSKGGSDSENGDADDTQEGTDAQDATLLDALDVTYSDVELLLKNPSVVFKNPSVIIENELGNVVFITFKAYNAMENPKKFSDEIYTDGKTFGRRLDSIRTDIGRKIKPGVKLDDFKGFIKNPAAHGGSVEGGKKKIKSAGKKVQKAIDKINPFK